MSRIRYNVAMSLDGYIAAANGNYDWILPDPEVNFAELWAQFDTFLMGRRTYEVAKSRVGQQFHGMKVAVVSRTMKPADHPNMTILPEPTHASLESLRSQSRKDIWLFGGGELFHALLSMNEIDTVEVSIIPILLGGGTRLLPDPARRAKLRLTGHKIYRSGIVTLTYDVQK